MQGIHSIVIHSKLCMFSFLVYSIKLFNITYFIAYGADNATRELPDLYNLQILIASCIRSQDHISQSPFNNPFSPSLV